MSLARIGYLLHSKIDLGNPVELSSNSKIKFYDRYQLVPYHHCYCLVSLCL